MFHFAYQMCIMRYKLILYYTFGSIVIICMFVKNYGRVKHPPLLVIMATFDVYTIRNYNFVYIFYLYRGAFTRHNLSLWRMRLFVHNTILVYDWLHGA